MDLVLCRFSVMASTLYDLQRNRDAASPEKVFTNDIGDTYESVQYHTVEKCPQPSLYCTLYLFLNTLPIFTGW